MNSPPLDLSIVIPAFNEEHRLPKAIEQIGSYLSARSLRAEIIVVDDGSSDATPNLIERYRGKYPGLRLISNGANRGKGFSVRHGVLEARGEIVLFTDADLSTPIEEADKLLVVLHENGCDVAIASRWIAGLEFSDTQCGFKAFRREPARIIFEQQRIERFGFDPEILFLAKRHGLRVAEIPVRWSHDSATKVNVVGDGIRMFLELGVIRWNSLRGRYPVLTGSLSGFTANK